MSKLLSFTRATDGLGPLFSRPRGIFDAELMPDGLEQLIGQGRLVDASRQDHGADECRIFHDCIAPRVGPVAGQLVCSLGQRSLICRAKLSCTGAS